MLFAMLDLHHMRLRQRSRLRFANKKLLHTTDQVRGSDTNVLLHGHRLLPEQALSNDIRSRQKNNNTSEKERVTAPIEQRLRQGERRVFIEKKKMDHLKLKRTALRSDLFFTLIELTWPRHDHSRLEGYTGFITSICNISRLAGESRWPVLED
jgi:hypothetical protein